MFISTTQLSFLLLAVSSSLAIASPHGPPSKPSADKGRPCGFKIAPCANGYYCRANDLSCPSIRQENCAGTCQPGRNPVSFPTKPAKPKYEPSPPVWDGVDFPRTEYKSCGGFRVAGQESCATGEYCIDDPYKIEKGSCGMACDAPGICVKPELCGGFAGFKCKDPSKKCFDDPRDDCDPKNGGADCSGICV